MLHKFYVFPKASRIPRISQKYFRIYSAFYSILPKTNSQFVLKRFTPCVIPYYNSTLYIFGQYLALGKYYQMPPHVDGDEKERDRERETESKY